LSSRWSEPELSGPVSVADKPEPKALLAPVSWRRGTKKEPESGARSKTTQRPDQPSDQKKLTGGGQK